MTPYQYKRFDGKIIDISWPGMNKESTAKIAAQRHNVHRLKAALVALRDVGYTQEEILGFTKALLKGCIVVSLV
jgi:hypothetical protein